MNKMHSGEHILRQDTKKIDTAVVAQANDWNDMEVFKVCLRNIYYA